MLFYQKDITEISSLEAVFKTHPEITGVIHFAAKKAVGESCEKPFLYYDTNILGTQNLLKVMHQYGKKDIVFSSSATVYDAASLEPPFREEDRLATYNPYGTTKLVMEYMLQDLARFKGFRVMNLRYFNPIGAHPSALIGENPRGIPSNLVPYVLKVAKAELPFVQIFGDDYETADGTGVRDYIHVMDVAEAHLSAYRYLQEQRTSDAGTFEVLNIGTGKGTSVKEIVDLVAHITGKAIPSKIVARRSGDVATSVADPQKAQKLLDWEAKRSVAQAIEDAWRYLHT